MLHVVGGSLKPCLQFERVTLVISYIFLDVKSHVLSSAIVVQKHMNGIG